MEDDYFVLAIVCSIGYFIGILVATYVMARALAKNSVEDSWSVDIVRRIPASMQWLRAVTIVALIVLWLPYVLVIAAWYIVVVLFYEVPVAIRNSLRGIVQYLRR